MEKMEEMFESSQFVDMNMNTKIEDMRNMLKSIIEHMTSQQAGSSNAHEGEKYMV